MLRTKTVEKYTRSNAGTDRNLSTRMTENKWATRNGGVNNHIAEHHLQTEHQIDWDFATCITYSTDYYQRLTLESWFTNLGKRHWIVVNSYRHRTNDLLTKSSKTNYERTTGELTIWLTIDDCLTVTIDGSKRTNYWLRVFIANNITA